MSTPTISFQGTILRRTELQRAKLLAIAEYADDNNVSAVQGADGHTLYCSYRHGGMRCFRAINADGGSRTLTLHDVIDARD